MKKRFIAILVVISIFVMNFTVQVSAANCTHNNNQWTGQTRGDPNCTQGGGKIYNCRTCGNINYDTEPLGHQYKYKVCTRTASCGKVNTTNSNHFQYYMYRKGNHARNISCGWLGYSGHYAIDIVDGTGYDTYQYPIYAQGPGTVIKRSDSGSESGARGHFIIIKYDNGYTVRYLHLDSRSPCAVDTRVNNEMIIGYTGWTGDVEPKSRYGTHLHYDVNNLDLEGGMTSEHIDPTTLYPSGTFS